MSIRWRFAWFSMVAWSLLFSVATADEPLKVFILVGQSNMQGHAQVKTIEHLRADESTLAMYQSMIDSQGKPKVHPQVWISYLSSDGVKQGPLSTGFGADANKIGPELTFGIEMQRQLNEPILIIKTAWGGKSLHTDFRSPSGGPFVIPESQLKQLAEQGKDISAIQAEKIKASGVNYREMIAHVKSTLANIDKTYPAYDAQAGYEIAGLVWFQGWNDMVDGGVYPQRDQAGGYDLYSELLAHFIRDVRRDLDTPQLPVVVGVMGVGGPVAEYGPDEQRYSKVHQNFRDAMAAPAKLDEFKANVTNVLTEQYWDPLLDQLVHRRDRLNQQLQREVKERSLEGAAAKQRELELRRELFSESEWETLQIGVSNQAYHYLGSAKILGRTGHAFAEAMSKLLDD